MPSKAKLEKTAWKNYGAWSQKAANDFEISMSYSRAKLAASGLQVTDELLQSVQSPIQEQYDKDMKDFKDTESYNILKKNYKTVESGANQAFAKMDAELNTRQVSMVGAEKALLGMNKGGSGYAQAETNYQNAKDLYDSGVAIKEESKELRGVYGTLDTYYAAKYDDKADMSFMGLDGEVAYPSPRGPNVQGEGKDEPYSKPSKPGLPNDMAYGEYEAYV